jgi:Fe2+ transport system protein FeoA
MSASNYRLDQIASGTVVTVCQVQGKDHAMDRLQAMGLCVGRQMEVVRRGNPLVVHLLGARLGLSGHLAKRIIVTHRST